MFHVARRAHEHGHGVRARRRQVLQLLRYPLEVALHRVQIRGGHRCQVAVHLLVHHEALVTGGPEPPRVRVDDVGYQDVT